MTDPLTAAIKVVEKLRNGPGIYEPFGSSLIAVIAAASELQQVRDALQQQIKDYEEQGTLLLNANRDYEQVRAERDALARDVRVGIPTAAMEQEFAAHYRRGRESMQAEALTLRNAAVNAAEERDALAKELDFTREGRMEFERQFNDHIEKIVVAELERDAAIEKTREAHADLLFYGTHLPDCEWEPCNCGYDNVLAKFAAIATTAKGAKE